MAAKMQKEPSLDIKMIQKNNRLAEVNYGF